MLLICQTQIVSMCGFFKLNGPENINNRKKMYHVGYLILLPLQQLLELLLSFEYFQYIHVMIM